MSRYTPYFSKFVPLLTVAAFSLTGCSLFKTKNSQTTAAIGLPTAFNVEYQADALGLSFVFITKDAKGAEVRVQRKAKGNPYSNIQFYKEDASKQNWGSLMDKNPSEEYGFVSSSPWECSDLETLVYNEVKSTKPEEANQLCIFELHTTGKSGEASGVIVGLNSVVGAVIPLTADVVKKVVEKYVLQLAGRAPPVIYAPVKDSLNAAAGAAPAVSLKSVPVLDKPNMAIVPSELTAAIFEVYSKFKTDTTDPLRQTCFYNFRTAENNWTDASTHYWCQFPLDARTCYVEKLVALRAESDAGLVKLGLDPLQTPLLARAGGARKFHAGAFAKCLADGNDEFVWINQDDARKNQFFAIMTSVLTAGDMNIDQEQEGINGFYAKLGITRTRRVNDTYPEWLGEQPRYIQYRLGQAANLQNWATLQQEAADFAAKLLKPPAP